MTVTGFTKDPQAVLDYVWDWTDWLGEDTILTANFEMPEGLTLDSSSVNEEHTRVTAWISGGVEGQNYEVTCRIATLGARIDDRTVRFKIRSR